MKEKLRCPKCGADCYDGDKSCSNCGNEFVYVCRNCKKHISYDAEVCKYCNQSLGKMIIKPYKGLKLISTIMLVIGLVFVWRAIVNFNDNIIFTVECNICHNQWIYVNMPRGLSPNEVVNPDECDKCHSVNDYKIVE